MKHPYQQLTFVASKELWHETGPVINYKNSLFQAFGEVDGDRVYNVNNYNNNLMIQKLHEKRNGENSL